MIFKLRHYPEDGVLEFSHGDAIAVMDLGEEFEPSRKSARLLLQLIDDGRHLPTINERLKAVPVDAHTLLNLVWMLRNEGRKLNAKKAAGSKNATAREWVRDRWVHRVDREQSKSAFSLEAAHLVRIKFDEKVTPGNITSRWLKGLD